MAYRLAARPERFTSARTFDVRSGNVQYQSRSGVTVVKEAIQPPLRSIGESLALQSNAQSVKNYSSLNSILLRYSSGLCDPRRYVTGEYVWENSRKEGVLWLFAETWQSQNTSNWCCVTMAAWTAPVWSGAVSKFLPQTQGPPKQYSWSDTLSLRNTMHISISLCFLS